MFCGEGGASLSGIDKTSIRHACQHKTKMEKAYHDGQPPLRVGQVSRRYDGFLEEAAQGQREGLLATWLSALSRDFFASWRTGWLKP